MRTTTIRVDADTHTLLVELSASTGATLMQTTRDAADALRRLRFADQVTDELDILRQDASAWAEYLAEAESTTVTDGIG